MRKVFTLIAGVFVTASLYAQAPEKMSYQAVIRDAANNLVTSSAVGMRISILQGSANGTPVYVETHTPTSNANGLVSLEVGAGVVVSGTFAFIDWGNGPYFIKTETAPTGGTNYTITGTSQLISVPYALHSKCVPVAVSPTGDTLTIGCHKVIIPGISSVNPPGGGDGYPSGTVHCEPTNPTAIVDVTNPTTGKIWMDRNLGASQVSISSVDNNSYGDLYQWGRRSDGHQCRTSPTTSTLSNSSQPAHGNFILSLSAPNDWLSTQNTNLWQGVNGVNNPCPNGYRLPTESEFSAEISSWGGNNASNAFAAPLKWAMSGYRDRTNGALIDVNSRGSYWSSTVSTTFTRGLSFNSTGAVILNNNRALGLAVRCIKE
jgi:uncharacterized protein (TIGR02145 family)